VQQLPEIATSQHDAFTDIYFCVVYFALSGKGKPPGVGILVPSIKN